VPGTCGAFFAQYFADLICGYLAQKGIAFFVRFAN
jgi:hypothetical protein